MGSIKVGMIGTGSSARSHLEALRRLNRVEVVAIASSSQERAEQVAKEFGIPKAYGDARQLIHDPEVEAVHNCTPNHLHFPINREVLSTGKHLLSEKPLALNSQESRQLTEWAQKSEGVSGVCFNYRHYPMVAEARAAITGGECGRVYLVQGGYLQDWLLYNTDYNWRLEPEQSGSTRAVADIGSHWCDTVQHVLGRRIVEVFADLKTVHPVRYKPKGPVTTFAKSGDGDREEIPIHTEDCGIVLVHFEGGIQGVFTVSQVSAGKKTASTSRSPPKRRVWPGTRRSRTVCGSESGRRPTGSCSGIRRFFGAGRVDGPLSRRASGGVAGRLEESADRFLRRSEKEERGWGSGRRRKNPVLCHL